MLLLFALAPALAALASTPWFVTQDGPAHLYNAEVLARSFDADSPFASFYRVRWEPLPNWAGHLALMILHAIVPARGANLALDALTLAGFSASVLWLRWRVAGARGLGVAALLSALLGLNVAWLLGFTSFLLGACLFPITLGVWWAGRDRLGWGRVSALAAMLVMGYFGHLVSLGLTVVGLAVLATLTPCREGGRQAWASRLGRTASSMVPLIPLGLLYLNLSRRGGPMRPEWGNLADPLSPRAWATQVGWADPISIAAKRMMPFGDTPTRAAAVLAPVAWLLIALVLSIVATLRAHARSSARDASERRGWTALATLLILGGMAGPDTLGAGHGNYLPQRIVLLGLVALVPALDLDPGRRAIRGSALALVVALTVQSALVWDYAITSERTAGAFWRRARRLASGRGSRRCSCSSGTSSAPTRCSTPIACSASATATSSGATTRPGTTTSPSSSARGLHGPGPPRWNDSPSRTTRATPTPAPTPGSSCSGIATPRSTYSSSGGMIPGWTQSTHDGSGRPLRMVRFAS